MPVPSKIESSGSLGHSTINVEYSSTTKVEYSSTATRRALCVGIQDGSDNSSEGGVPGAHEDAQKMAEFLKSKGFEVITMLSSSRGPLLPTRNNIRKAIQRLTMNTKRGDRLLFSFSGHGTQIKTEDKTEIDGFDEVILPSDAKPDDKYPEDDRRHWDPNTIIIDNDLHDWLIHPLPLGSYLTVVLDSCHSGTAMDLKYVRSYNISASGQYLTNLWGNRSSPHPRVNDIRTLHVDDRRLIIRGSSLDNLPFQSEPVDGPAVCCWSSCPDSDESLGSKKGGLFTTAWVDCFAKSSHPKLTMTQALTNIHLLLENEANIINAKLREQRKEELIIHTPQFSCYRKADLDAFMEIFF